MPTPSLTKLPALLLCAALALAAGADVALAERPARPAQAADGVRSAPAAIDPLVGRVADRTTLLAFDRWDWDSGVAMYGMMTAWRATGERRYRDYVQGWVDGFIARGGPSITHTNHVAPGLAVLMLYEDTGQEKYLAAAQPLANYLLSIAPRSREGALYHHDDQLWVDTLFMAAPFLARFGRDTGDPRYTEEAVKQVLLHARHLQDERTGLFFHGWDESDDSHMSGAFWQRGNGWAMAAGAELLDQLPADHVARPRIRDILSRQAAGLAPLQDRSGRWHTVVDRSDFYLETSGAAAIAYALFRGLDQGWLDVAQGGLVAQRAREGVSANVDGDGTVLDVSAGTGVAPTVEVYNGISRDAIQPYGQGLTLLLVCQRLHGFQLAAEPPLTLVAPGGTARVTLAVTAAYGTVPSIDFGVTGSPDTVSWSVRHHGFAEAPGAQLVLTATAQAAPGTYPLTVTARADDLTRTADLSLRVVAPIHTLFLPYLTRHDDGRPELTRLTNNPGRDWQPTMAPDGRLAFLSDRSGVPHVMVQAPGAPPMPIQLAGSREEDRPVFAKDGRLAFSARSMRGDWDAVIYSPGAPWYPLGWPASSEVHPAISPDGRFMTYVSDMSGNWEIYVIELRRVDPQLTFHLAADRVPSWSPDGREIVFRSEWQGNSDIYAMPSGIVPDQDGIPAETLRRLTADPKSDSWPAFSPDGQWVVFQSDRAGSNDIYVMDREGGQVTPVISDPADDLSPAWSPDGRYILFASDRAGDHEIYRVPFTPPTSRPMYPNHRLADRIWQAMERLAEVHPPRELFPGYAAEAGGPSAANARRNVDAACHDFPDLPDPFGPGAHHRACYEWTAADLALYHAARARHLGWGEDAAWAGNYLDAALDDLEAFVYGPEDRPGGQSFRDGLAGIWQNPLRAVSIALAADLLRQRSALGAERQARVEELLSGIARAWYAEFWRAGSQPTTGGTLTTRTALDGPATSLGGKQVVSTKPWTFSWDADKGNSPAEEAAWLGAGAMLASRVLGARLPESGDIYAAGRHTVDFALAYDRPDPVHGGLVRTLNNEATGGIYGQRRFWLENHTADTPSIPYVGTTWHFLDTALFASALGDQQPWPSLVPDDAQWDVLKRSAGESLRAADGTFLVDLTPGGGIGFNLDRFPEWWTSCGQGQAGRQYVRYDGRAGGPALYVSEIGHAAGLDLVATGWPLMRIAAARGDQATYANWADRLARVLDEYIARPPNPGWAACKTAGYVSANPGYHWTRMMGMYVVAQLGASGYELGVWDR